MKVLTFGRQFPKGHPKAGQPTRFPEKIMAYLADKVPNWTMKDDFVLYDWHEYYNCTMLKHHTIRAGKRWNPGDMASLRVWSGKPRRSPQIEFAQVEVKKVWGVEIVIDDDVVTMKIDGVIIDTATEVLLAKNDGLGHSDFISWFNIHPKKKQQVFTGQIICWSNDINY